MQQIDSVGEYVNNRTWTELCLKSLRALLELMSWASSSARTGLLARVRSRGRHAHRPLQSGHDGSAGALHALRREVLKRGATIVNRPWWLSCLPRTAAWLGCGIPMDSDGLVVFHAKAVVLAAAPAASADLLAHQQPHLRRRLHGLPGGRRDHRQGVRGPALGPGGSAAFSSFGRFGRSPDGGRPARGMPVDAEGNRPPARWDCT